MGLQRKCNLGDIFEHVNVNVYDIATKKIIFTGSYLAAGNFLGIPSREIQGAAKNKYRLKGKYAIRLKKINS